jgi:hypothetical protein
LAINLLLKDSNLTIQTVVPYILFSFQRMKQKL